MVQRRQQLDEFSPLLAALDRRARPGRPPAGCPRDRAALSDARLARPRRRSPAAARMMPAYRPSSSLRSRVFTLPRSGCTSRCGKRARSWLSRRRLEVPTDGAGWQLLAGRGSGSPRTHRADPRARRSRRSESRPAGASARLSSNARRCRRALLRQRGLQLLDEQALAADLGQRARRACGRPGSSSPGSRPGGRMQGSSRRSRMW